MTFPKKLADFAQRAIVLSCVAATGAGLVVTYQAVTNRMALARQRKMEREQQQQPLGEK